jgi:hypothetical protein
MPPVQHDGEARTADEVVPSDDHHRWYGDFAEPVPHVERPWGE